ncbi:hypothetical protein SAMN05421823_1068 [Catalinimonas alkaloidigena]|uniref:Uncharacterized protein n=1 Tax=Catalinimonas alkaloidigena TaxID=1075417 RepID=A0A1G9K1S1_9BACT|nr:hypothetical protein SAMN05421823_1068 [Catalinimonas alkaloidigena]
MQALVFLLLILMDSECQLLIDIVISNEAKQSEKSCARR